MCKIENAAGGAKLHHPPKIGLTGVSENAYSKHQRIETGRNYDLEGWLDVYLRNGKNLGSPHWLYSRKFILNFLITEMLQIAISEYL